MAKLKPTTVQRIKCLLRTTVKPAIHTGDKVDCYRNRRQIGNKVDCRRYGQLCCRFWRQISNDLNSTACRGRYCRQLGRLCCRHGRLCRQYVRGQCDNVYRDLSNDGNASSEMSDFRYCHIHTKPEAVHLLCYIIIINRSLSVTLLFLWVSAKLFCFELSEALTRGQD